MTNRMDNDSCERIGVVDEDENDDLIQNNGGYCSMSDDEASETSGLEGCDDLQTPLQIHHYLLQSQPEFFFIKSILVVSALAVLLLQPMYSQALNVKSNVHAMILATSTFFVLGALVVQVILKLFSNNWAQIKIYAPPMSLLKLGHLAALYASAGFIIVYALDRKRVICHLQDPLKALLLVVSLLFYFIFCKKMMGLRRIFATTIIIVGLFISVDYGLCDEFRCRGFEVIKRSDDAGTWSWHLHCVWTALYIFGLVLFSGYHTLMERYIVCSEMASNYPTLSKQILMTISRLVSTRTIPDENADDTRPVLISKPNTNLKSTIHFVFWIHLLSWIFINVIQAVFLAIPQSHDNSTDIGKEILDGMACHFSSSNGCENVPLFGWLFMISYGIFTLSCTKFLILNQSTIYTMATMTAAIPLLGIWWTFFVLSPDGVLTWNVTLTGEFICTLLGLPLVAIGLGFFWKSHSTDCQAVAHSYRARSVPSTTCVSSNYLA